MKRIGLLIICVLTFGLSCKQNVDSISEVNEYSQHIFASGQKTIVELVEKDSLIFLDKFLIPENHIEYMKESKLGSIVRAYRLISPLRGLDERIYIIDDDIQISYSSLDSLLAFPTRAPSSVFDANLSKASEVQSQEAAQEEVAEAPFHFRTINLVEGNPIINVSGINVENQNLRLAILNSLETYNNLELEISFQFVGWYTAQQGITKEQFNNWKKDGDIDIVITEVTGDGGLAGFPTNDRRPHDYITIGQDIEPNYGMLVAQHVVTHELGHCIGVRHTDYFDRSISCGKGGDEGQGKYGAVHIPGTPKMNNVDMNSVMLACYNSGNTGELSRFDKVALEYIYGK